MIVLLFYLFGIFMGLYLNDMALFFSLGMVIFISIIIRSKKIIVPIVLLVLGIIYIRVVDNNYSRFYNTNNYSGSGIVTQIEKSTKYKNVYLVKIDKIYLKVYTSKNIELEYGDVINFDGDFSLPEGKRNEFGFDNRNFLKQKRIVGYVFAKSVSVEGKNTLYYFLSIKQVLKKHLKQTFSDESYGFINGILLADSSEIDDVIQDNFQKSSLLHILAVSGMHISIIENILNTFFEKLKVHKKISKLIIIILLFLYMLLIGAPVSCMRAIIMESLECVSFILNKKTSFKNNIIISLIIICIINPYNICNAGLWLSYGGTIGIVYASHFFSKKINKKVNKQNKIVTFVINNIAVSLSVQLFITPIIIYYFNSISMSCLISNLIITPLIAPLVYIIIISIITNFSLIIDVLIKILYKEIELVARIKFLNIYIARPSIVLIALYYVSLFFIIYKLKNNFLKNYRLIYRYKKVFLILICVFVVIYNLYLLIPNKYMEFDFIDVGQGDCSLVITPHHKTILIDGGNNKDFDNGEKTILPILINKHIRKIDYILISHFDSDHVGGLFSILNKYQVERVIISKQAQSSENFKRFIQLINENKIGLIVVNQGDRLFIEKEIYLDILWPNEKNIIKENCLNNNSIVCKLTYYKMSILFTGDIEEEAEKEILKECNQQLASTITKVAHHGSQTSSTEDFLEAVNPKVALIGVGKDNEFNHPNDIIIDRLQDRNIKIYRTDYDGQIKIKLEKVGKGVGSFFQKLEKRTDPFSNFVD